MFIGYYNLANFITITGLSASVAAVFLALNGYYKLAMIALLLAGLSDMFDGRVARHANRSDRKAKMFGIQIDTVCDMVSFGVSPAIIAYIMGCNRWYDGILLVFYTICGAIRLAYFNTQAITETEDLSLKVFTGVPIPTICFALPPLALLMTFIDNACVMSWIFRIVYLCLGFAYISKFKIKKPKLSASIVMITVMLAVVVALLLCGDVKPF